jgi:hypothetical protein
MEPWLEGYTAGYAAAMGEIPYPERSPYPEGSSKDALWHIGFVDAWEDQFPEEPDER